MAVAGITISVVTFALFCFVEPSPPGWLALAIPLGLATAVVGPAMHLFASARRGSARALAASLIELACGFAAGAIGLSGFDFYGAFAWYFPVGVLTGLTFLGLGVLNLLMAIARYSRGD